MAGIGKGKTIAERRLWVVSVGTLKTLKWLVLERNRWSLSTGIVGPRGGKNTQIRPSEELQQSSRPCYWRQRQIVIPIKKTNASRQYEFSMTQKPELNRCIQV